MEKKSFANRNSTLFTLLFPIVYVLLGALLLFVPDINTKVLAELLGALLIVAGAALIIHYFLSRSYLDMRAYGFSIGMLAIVLGVCAILKAQDVANSLSVCLNICIMLTAIVKLQNAIQLKFLKSIFWIPVLCVSIAFLVCTVLIALNPFPDGVRDTFTYIVLLCDGVASFANALLLRTVTNRMEKRVMESALEKV